MLGSKGLSNTGPNDFAILDLKVNLWMDTNSKKAKTIALSAGILSQSVRLTDSDPFSPFTKNNAIPHAVTQKFDYIAKTLPSTLETYADY